MATTNHECYVSLEVAKLLKQAGFDWKQYNFYNSKGVLINGTFAANWNEKIWHIDGSKVSAPTIEIAQRWLREVKVIHMCVRPNKASADCKYFVTVIVNDTKWGNVQDDNRKTNMFDTYEEAQEAGIKKALEIILEKGD